MTETEQTKQCPYCAETIKAAAVVCRFCGKDLVGVVVPPAGIALKVPVDGGKNWQCSNCKGYIRGDATQCKHCKAVFSGIAAAPITAPAKKPSSPAAYILVTLVVFGALAWLIFGGPRTRTSVPSFGPSGGTSLNARYEITGPATGASLTYTNASGGIQQNDVSLPWNTSFSARPGQFLSISAQKKGTGGTITCRITVDGVEIQQASSNAEYGIASCSGSAR
jgi:hypothetical protein